MRLKPPWQYPSRAVDASGATLDLMLRAIRDAEAAARFFRKVLQASISMKIHIYDTP
jgi:transposase-like protein